MDRFAALGDPTRRKIVEKLALQGQLSATQIAQQFEMTPQAISQHLKILRGAQVVQMEKRAQQRLYRINSESLQEIESWARQTAQRWTERFDAIATLLDEQAAHDQNPNNEHKP